jgi:hypothetical protein
MKIRTLNELQDCLDKDRAWRIKEIDYYRTAVKRVPQLAQDTVIRAGVPLLYAHWEGFVKCSATYYLTFVASKRLKFSELAPPFIAICARQYLAKASGTRQFSLHMDVAKFFMGDQDRRVDLPVEGVINTQANLNSTVFRNIAASIGLEVARYEPRFHLMDVSLLGRRNAIAHGEYLDVDGDHFESIAKEVITLTEWFKADIQNAASLEKYRRVCSIWTETCSRSENITAV